MCIFRNNHFSTLLKRDGKIFLLLTDLGFEQQRNFVWEVLDGIDGDTTLATSKFKKAPLSRIADKCTMQLCSSLVLLM